MQLTPKGFLVQAENPTRFGCIGLQSMHKKAHFRYFPSSPLGMWSIQNPPCGSHWTEAFLFVFLAARNEIASLIQETLLRLRDAQSLCTVVCNPMGNGCRPVGGTVYVDSSQPHFTQSLSCTRQSRASSCQFSRSQAPPAERREVEARAAERRVGAFESWGKKKRA